MISGCTIDYFLSWPEEALIAVSRGLVGDFEIECEPHEKEQLIVHMGTVHSMAVEVCEQYFREVRRSVYQTPKSFLSFLSTSRPCTLENLPRLR